MRILTVSTLDHGGGAEAVACDLAEGYAAHGHESWIAVGTKRSSDPRVLTISRARNHRPRNPDAPEPETPEAIAAAAADGLEDFSYPGSWDLLDLPPQPPDLVHCHNLHGGYFDLRFLPRLSRRVPTLLTLHDNWLLTGHCAHPFACERWRTGCGDCPDLSIYPRLLADGSAANWRRKRDLYAGSRLYVSTPSRWLMDRVEAGILRQGMMAGRVIPNGIDTDVFCPGDRAGARQALDLPQDALILLFTANGIKANPWKDYPSTRAVMERLGALELGRPLVLVNLGDRGEPERIGSATVRFVPFQRGKERVAAYYRAADIYLHMARMETFPSVILEAMCCGTPVAATAVGGITEQIDSAFGFPKGGPAHGPERATGVLVGPAAVEDMVEALRRLLTDDGLRRRLGTNAAALGRPRFDLRRAVRDYVSWLEEIAQDCPAGPVTA
ncbi:glycosyltransferase [Azospirillum thermophilum]|nr:glycosyltransferase [Azospirillum thermophilum]